MFKSKFKFSTDSLIQKSENDEYFEIEGLASTDDRDLEGEIIKQNFDLSAIMAGKGYLNDDHGQNYEVKDHARIGVIDKAEVRPEGLWIKGKVFKNHPAAIPFLNELKFKPGMVQFSVEGYSVKRDPRNKNTIGKAYVTGVALTRNPVNPYTYAQLAKSLSAGSSGLPEDTLVKSQDIHIIRDENDFVTSFQVVQELDPSHPDFIEYYAELVEKGGPGSGKKGQGGPKSPMNEHKKEVVINHDDKGSAKAPAKDGDNSRNRESKKTQRIDELKNEKEQARDSARTPEEAKRNVAEVKERHALSAKKKRVAVKKIEVKKSEVLAELMERASKNPEFKKSLEAVMNKALTSGGPAYATTLPGDMIGGQVFQTEELEADKKKKKDDESQ